MLLISGEKDHTVPWAITNASYKHQSDNKGVTEIVEMPGRGHALTIDSGWREVADTALAFAQRFSDPRPAGTGTPSSPQRALTASRALPPWRLTCPRQTGPRN
ncbi:MAG: alpha/beta hydrolase [Actinomycetia bacterium]|nr:alpha/beta hydrolase [Actinomycetes bacterium]